MKLYDLTLEHRHSPLGIDAVQPRFSWKLQSEAQNVTQTAYRLEVKANGEPMWDSDRVESAQSVLVEYMGPTVSPCTAYTWHLTVWNSAGETAEAQSSFETGLLNGSEFANKAQWITHGLPAESTASAVFSKCFTLQKAVRTARLYATALGVYEVSVNGSTPAETYFAPGWTNYRKRLQYQTYALETLHNGVNRIDFTLGNGWYKGMLGFMPTPNHYGNTLALLALLRIEYEDGTTQWLGTDETWATSTGEILFSELYDGEHQDTRLATAEAQSQEFTQKTAQLFDYGFDTLIAQENEPVRCVARLAVQKEFIAPNGQQLFDFGQNLTGWVEVSVQGRAGQTLTLRHAESLDENGNFYTENLSFAKATDTYILNGALQTLRPHFTFHGFRYLCVEGLEAGQTALFTACHLTTDLEATGSFACSHPQVNRLQQNIVWSQRDNFLDVPTDCPQRSERLGWTGDVTAFCPTAVFNQNIMPFMTKWLHDLASEQTRFTGTQQVVPDVLSDGVAQNAQLGAAFWGDVATVLPWTLYNTYGDKRVLVEQYDSMKLWVDFIQNKCGENGLWQTGFQYGDWLGLDTEANGLQDERKGATDDYFAANICYAWSLQILTDAARVLGNCDDAQRYAAQREVLVQSFQREYVTSTGRLVCETQTAMILALYFNIVEPQHRPRLIDMLEKNIIAHKTHLTTGFIGTPFACLALSECGLHALAGKLLLQAENPSWLYEVGMGATTIWERWNSILPDGSFNPANMNSLNHYSYGSIGNWLYTKLAGLTVVEPGYKRFALRPQFIQGITWVKLAFESVYGKIRVEWRCENGTITVDVEVPANTTALLALPEQAGEIELGSGVYHYEYATQTRLEAGRYSLDTSVRAVLNHPAGRAVLEQTVPELLQNEMMQYVMNEPITTLLGYGAEIKPVFDAAIEAMNRAEPVA